MDIKVVKAIEEYVEASIEYALECREEDEDGYTSGASRATSKKKEDAIYNLYEQFGRVK